MPTTTVPVESLDDIESILSDIFTRLYAIYDARCPDEDPDEPHPVWDKIDSLHEYLATVDADVRRTNFLHALQEIK